MTDLLAARSQMAMSLAFHILFACAGIAMPLLMALSEWRWIKTGHAVYLDLARRWAKGTAILFAVGAVSGTALSFELGLLWPNFMEHAGPIFGMPFSLEGFAFFTEAIFLGLYLYGWDRLRPKVHLATGCVVAFSGAVAGVFVVMANAWMNAPTGFDIVLAGQTPSAMPADQWAAQNPAIPLSSFDVAAIEPFKAMFNQAAFSQTVHMTIAAYLATGAAVVGIHAFMLLRDPENEFHRAAIRMALPVTILAAFLQPISGDSSARDIARRQPEKLAALEGVFKTQRGAPLHIGGIPNLETETMDYAISIPKGLSLLAFHEPNAKIIGLEAFPRDQWPNTVVVHIAFQIMVGCGFALMAVSGVAAVCWWRKKMLPTQKGLLKLFILSAPLGFLAVEAGWFVTEAGRQPWIIYRIMKVSDAVTPMPYLIVPLITFSTMYLFLGVIVVALLWWQVLSSPTKYRGKG